MASMTFTSLPQGEARVQKILNFDSSPAYSLHKALGVVMESVDLRKTSENRDYVHYDVYASKTRESELVKYGTLRAKTVERIRQELR